MQTNIWSNYYFQTSRKLFMMNALEEAYWFGSKVNFGTLPVTPCGHDTDHSFGLFTFKLHTKIVYYERRNPWDILQQGQGQVGHSILKLCGHNKDFNFFTNHSQTSHISSLWQGEEHYEIWVAGSKFKFNFGPLPVQHCLHDTYYRLGLITFKFCILVVLKNTWFWITGLKVKVNFITMSMKPFWH